MAFDYEKSARVYLLARAAGAKMTQKEFLRRQAKGEKVSLPYFKKVLWKIRKQSSVLQSDSTTKPKNEGDIPSFEMDFPDGERLVVPFLPGFMKDLTVTVSRPSTIRFAGGLLEISPVEDPK